MIQSYSSMATYEQCPQKYKFAYIDKIEMEKEPPSPAMERGLAVHKSIENYFNRSTEYLHPDIHANYGQFMFGIRESYPNIKSEFKWGITWEYEPCSYSDPRAMFHGFIDFLILPPPPTLLLYEWKTGKRYVKEHMSQTHLYSVAVLCHHPEYDSVDAFITYLDEVDSHKVNYPRAMMFEYKPMLRRIAGNIADATLFPPMPSFKCQWCPYSRQKGGPCPVA